MITRIPFLGFHEPISSLTHLITAIFFLLLGIKMIWAARGNATRVTSLIIYITCSVYLFTMSGVYHLLQKGTTGNYVLQILDHTGIYLMISGSFTPFQIILLRGFKRWIPLCIMWILAITGLTLTAIFFKTIPEWLLLSFFISMGWMSLFTVWFIRNIDIRTVSLIFVGGVLYTVGALVDYDRWPVLIPQVLEAHEIFHIFVSAAAIVHFYAIYKISKIPISDQLTVIVSSTPKDFRAYFTSEHAFFKANSDEQLRQKVKNWINEKYIRILRPKRIRLRYFKEDDLDD